VDYCVWLWSPQFKKDVERLERVQRRDTMIIKELENLPYKEILKEFGFSAWRRDVLGGPHHSIPKRTEALSSQGTPWRR